MKNSELESFLKQCEKIVFTSCESEILHGFIQPVTDAELTKIMVRVSFKMRELKELPIQAVLSIGTESVRISSYGAINESDNASIVNWFCNMKNAISETEFSRKDDLIKKIKIALN
jgi:hypothetical protein